MQVRMKATKLAMTDAIRDYCQKKMDMLDKYLGGRIPVINCDLEVEKTVGNQNKGEIFRAEVNLEVPHEILRVEKTEKDLYKAVDKVKEHLEMAIEKYKGKLIDKHKGK